MPHFQSKQFSQSWLYLFLAAHLIAWTLVPALVRYTLPLDAMEGATWGHQLEWGYDKNPYLNAWLTSLAVQLGGQSGWMVYLFSQLCVIACMWSMWRLAGNIFGGDRQETRHHLIDAPRSSPAPIYALVSVLLLESIQYFNFHSIDFNDNTLELGLWGLSIYYFYQALRLSKKSAWILTGLFTGLALMAKYYTLVLLAGMGLFLLIYPENRKQLKTFPPYLGLITFLLLCLPHIIWLFSHDFITVRYVFERGSSIPHWSNHFIFPLKFLFQQFEAFLPVLILFGLLMLGKKQKKPANKHHPQRISISSFNKRFLFYSACLPLLLTMLLSLLLGTNLRAGWGTPLLSAWGIILIAVIQPQINKTKITVFLSGIFALLIMLAGAYAISILFSSTVCTANFPGREIARSISEEWHHTYHSKLEYVAGSRWEAGNVSFYSADHPAVLIEWDRSRSPWINLKEMKKKGGVFIWEIKDTRIKNEDIKKQIQQEMQQEIQNKIQEYPGLANVKVKVMEFNWHQFAGNKASMNFPPVKIALAFLPPNSASPFRLNKKFSNGQIYA
jgi:4-amino-4-deoxy-L-arabinose transferase-like glycosyltransferase